MMDKKLYDICVIGGGVNGCGIARDAAGRGYKVLLLEKGDLAEATSSASTKLIHGGLRYLELYEFGLVRKALKERDILLNIAPHIIWPIRFILPHAPHLRPLWLIRLGVSLYDFLARGTTLKKSFKTDIKNIQLNKKFNKGIEYSDCWVEDSRLVVLNAMDAMARGADIKTRTECARILPENEFWSIETTDGEIFHAQTVVNAAGPWAAQMMTRSKNVKVQPIRLVKGSHMVIPKLFSESQSYILQNEDGRIVFAIPYENDYTLIGTTDVDIGQNPDQTVQIDHNEIKYLKDIVKHYFDKTIRDIDIIHTYSGVRPLIDNDKVSASEASRDYEFDLQTQNGLTMLTVLGGKLTTYRVLAQEAMDKVDRLFHKKPFHWTGHEKLPGGDIPDNDFNKFVEKQAAAYPFLSKSLVRRYARAYGTCMNIILQDIHSLNDMGEEIGGGVYGRELDYLIAYEFAQTARDVLWRRSKLGLHLDKAAQEAIAAYMEGHA